MVSLSQAAFGLFPPRTVNQDIHLAECADNRAIGGLYVTNKTYYLFNVTVEFVLYNAGDNIYTAGRCAYS